MRVFISSYNWFSLAIPIRFVSSIFINPDKSDYKIFYNHENRNTYISLPLLLNCPQENIRHGIILKNGEANDNQMENRVILLGAEIENESDIPSDSFYPVPKTFNVMQFSFVFSGISFNKLTGGIVLLLDPEHLVQNIQKELII
ncbi:MAG: hypothetical protein FWB95_00060 [Treponema sp.]|nr:hypothetical protein [Treponema sp.]